jgi:hypothetical protein
VCSIIYIQIAVIELVETNRNIFFIDNIYFKYNLFSRFGCNRIRYRNIVWFIKTDNYMFKMRKNILLSHLNLSSSIHWIILKGITYKWTHNRVFIPKYWFKIENLSVSKIQKSITSNQSNPISFANSRSQNSFDRWSIISFDRVCIGRNASNLFKSILRWKSFGSLIWTYLFTPGFF